MGVILSTDLPNLAYRAKGWDVYDLGEVFLWVATDRLLLFDQPLSPGIPRKGEVVARLCAFWYQRTASLVPNPFLRLIESPQDLREYGGGAVDYWPLVRGRSLVVRRAEPLPILCAVVGYLADWAWQEFRERGTVANRRQPSRLVVGEPLPSPVLRVSLKGAAGPPAPLAFQDLATMVGEEVAWRVEEASYALYRHAELYLRQRGLILAHLRLEFGLLEGAVVVMGELLTPESCRLWPGETYEPGLPLPSFTTAAAQDWLEASGWDKHPPAPELPPEVVEHTSQRYQELYRRVTGEGLPGPYP